MNVRKPHPHKYGSASTRRMPLATCWICCNCNLKMQTGMFESMFCAEFNLMPQGRQKHGRMLLQLMLSVRDMVEGIGDLQAQLDALRQDARVLKCWLKQKHVHNLRYRGTLPPFLKCRLCPHKTRPRP